MSLQVYKGGADRAMSSRPNRSRGRPFWRGNRGRGRGRGRGKKNTDAESSQGDGRDTTASFGKRSRSRSHSETRSPESKKSLLDEDREKVLLMG